MNPLTINVFRYYPDRFFKHILAMSGFKSLYIRTKIGRHHIYRYKGGSRLPRLVILHGGGDSAGSYMPLLLQLKQSFGEIIAIESLGHGLSNEPKHTYTFNAHYQSMNEVLDSLISPKIRQY